MAEIYDIGNILVCDKVTMVSHVNEKYSEDGYFFNVWVVGRNDPFVFVAENEERCKLWRDGLIEKIKET